MGDLLSIPTICISPDRSPIADLGLEDAAALRATCCPALAFAAPFRGALAFSLSRHHLDVASLSLRFWDRIWKSCINEAKRAGYPSGIFAHALDVATDDPSETCELCKQVPPGAAASFLRWTWDRLRAKGQRFNFGDDSDLDENRIVFSRVLGDMPEPQWTSDELVAVVALKAYYVNREGGMYPTLLKAAALLVLRDGRLALLWSLCSLRQHLCTVDGSWEMQNGCAVLVGPDLSGLVEAAKEEFRIPVFTIRASRLDWHESEPPILDRPLAPHYHWQCGEVAAPPETLLASFPSTIRDVVGALSAYPRKPAAVQVMRETKVALRLEQSLSSPFGPGDRVILHGLVMRPELNDQLGNIRAPMGKRWSVLVEGLDAPVSLKPDNLARIDAKQDGIGTDAASEGSPAEVVGTPRSEENSSSRPSAIGASVVGKDEATSPIMNVDHQDPATPMSADESAAVANELWAGWLEQKLSQRAAITAETTRTKTSYAGSISSGQPASSQESSAGVTSESGESHVADKDSWVRRAATHDHEPARPTEFGEKIFVLRWSRHPRELGKALRDNPLLEPILAAANAAAHTCGHASGATMLLYPDQYECVLKLLSGFDLRPYHTIVNEAFKPLVEDAAAKLPCKANIRLRNQRPLAILPTSADSDETLVVENTFFTLVPVPVKAGSDASNAQTDPTGHKVRNPRALPDALKRCPP